MTKLAGRSSSLIANKTGADKLGSKARITASVQHSRHCTDHETRWSQSGGRFQVVLIVAGITEIGAKLPRTPQRAAYDSTTDP
ncbi:hypothetical protein [Sphingomonas oleivorans]|uniref:hypothetical protein n=1 Tax=Sphingomonas oleivorans TaxID=1735121 RepID=UPI0013FE0701|nr:hypothetical protein [Sphingomonas oleivorans]